MAKAKINSIEILISKALIDSYINQNKSALVNNVLRKCDDMKEAIDLFIKHGYIYIYIYIYILKCRRNTDSKNPKVLKTNV